MKDFSHAVCVPPKPGQASRFDALLKLIGDQSALVACPDGLNCTRDYGNIKSLKADDRRKAVSGAFKSKYNWENCGVLLIDDVLTTAATTLECIRVLKSGNASRVLVVALGKDQSALEHKLCPACGRAMKVRTNRYDGERFWGCIGYADQKNQCRYTEKILAVHV